MQTRQLNIYDDLLEAPIAGDPEKASKLTGLATRLVMEARRLKNKLDKATSNWEPLEVRDGYRNAIVQTWRKVNIAKKLAAGHLAGNCPCFLVGITNLLLLDRILQIVQPDADGDWSLKWDFCRRTGYLQPIGINNEMDFDDARQWVLDAMKEGKG